MPPFDAAEADFRRFAIKEGYPPGMLWTTPDELVFLGGRFWVLGGTAERRRERAKATFDHGAARNAGILIEGRCKTDQFTICRVYVAKDREDAENRLMPQSSVKLSLAVNEVPVALVPGRVIFRALKWWRKRKFQQPDWY